MTDERKSLTQLFVPICFETLCYMLAGMVDTLMLSSVNDQAVGAVGTANTYIGVFIIMFSVVSSGMIAVMTQYNAGSLGEHLNSSKWWDFGRKQGGLYVYTPMITPNNRNWYQGTADSMYQNIRFLYESHEPYVVIASGDGIYKMDYRKVLEYHIDKKADITVVCKDMSEDTDISRFGVVTMDEDNRIINMEEKPMMSEYRIGTFLKKQTVFRICRA